MRYSPAPIFLAVASLLGAQASPTASPAKPVAVLVRVADSLGAPVPDADVTIVRGATQAVANGTTNASGRTQLTIAPDPTPQQLVVRKIGFDRGYRFFSIAARDSISIELRLVRTVTTLAPVNVSAKEDLKRKSYHLDAEDILNSSRPIFDAADIFKLRPDMLNSRGGFKACEVPSTPRDGWIESVWVNGRRINLVPIDSEFIRSQKPALGISPGATRSTIVRGRVRFIPPKQLSHVDSVLSILHTIRPEHIAEITYHDCFDMSVNANHSDMAMFIALKPGVGYKYGIGSYVVNDSPANAHAAPVSDAPAMMVGALPRYRFRVLGIFDMDTGDPVGGAFVSDSVTGDRVTTTATGTVSLFFLPEGTTTVRVHRDGYRDSTLTVRISPADTVPITFMIGRKRPPATASIGYILKSAPRQAHPTGGWPRG